MTKQKRATAALLGLAFAGGTILTAGAAAAAVPAGQSTVVASRTISQAPANRPRCRWVHGHWRWDYRRGHRAWVRGHRICR